jgi:polysaccharide chain length determinant protein (PEP-CTERM system associated)
MESPVAQLKQFLQAVLARKRLFITVSALVAVLAVAASFFVPKVYEAKSTVFIERNVIESLMRGITITPSMEDRIRVLRYYMVSRDIVSRTLKKMEMDTNEKYTDPDAFEGLVRNCQIKTTINMRGNDLFFVSIEDINPYFASDYINTLTGIYVEENVATKREESYGATRFLNEQTASYKQKLDDIDAKIIDFRRKTGIFSNINENVLMAQVAADEEELRALKLRRNEMQATIETINQQLGMLKEALSDGFYGSSGSSEDARIGQLQAKIDELLIVYNDKHPSVVNLRDQIAEIQKRRNESLPALSPVNENLAYNPAEDPIYVDLKMRLHLTQSELNALSSKERDLAGRIAANQRTLNNFPEDKKILNDMERERATHLEIYQQILQRVGISNVSKDMEVADKATAFRIVDPAILPTNPIGVERIMLMLLGILSGFGAGLGTIYVLEKMDDSIRDSRSLKELGLTVLAEIPLILTEADNLLNRRRDKAAFTFASVCTVLVGFLFLHDLFGFSFIDGILGHFTNSGVSYRSPYGS